jgi:phosphatidylglycerophosphate synthase
MVSYLPNLLSLVRLAVGVGFPFAPPAWQLWLVAGAAASDLADGLIARRLGVAGTTGRYLDPVADKVVVLGVLVSLLASGLVSPGELALLALRDVVVVLGVVVLVIWGRRSSLAGLRPAPLGKLATAAQFAYLLLLLWRREPHPLALAAAATLSGLAGLDYLRRGLREMARTSRGGRPAPSGDLPVTNPWARPGARSPGST